MPLPASQIQSAELMVSSMSSRQKQDFDQYFAETLSDHHAMISRVVASYERVAARREELYQEIAVALWRALARFDHKSSLRTYILSIAHKRSISHVARDARLPVAVPLDETEIGGGHSAAHSCPSDLLSRQQRAKSLFDALGDMSMGDRQIVTLALEGLSYKDIGEILGLTVNHVGVKLQRAKAKLSRRLKARVSA